MVDIANKGEMLEKIRSTGILLLVILTAQALFSYLRTRLFVMVTEKTLASIRQHLYNHLIRLPMSFFSERRVGELNSRISSDISLLQDSLTGTLADLLSQMLVIIGGITFMMVSSYQLTLFTLAIVPAMALVRFLLRKGHTPVLKEGPVICGRIEYNRRRNTAGYTECKGVHQRNF